MSATAAKTLPVRGARLRYMHWKAGISVPNAPGDGFCPAGGESQGCGLGSKQGRWCRRLSGYRTEAAMRSGHRRIPARGDTDVPRSRGCCLASLWKARRYGKTAAPTKKNLRKKVTARQIVRQQRSTRRQLNVNGFNLQKAATQHVRSGRWETAHLRQKRNRKAIAQLDGVFAAAIAGSSFSPARATFRPVLL